MIPTKGIIMSAEVLRFPLPPRPERSTDSETAGDDVCSATIIPFHRRSESSPRPTREGVLAALGLSFVLEPNPYNDAQLPLT